MLWHHATLSISHKVCVNYDAILHTLYLYMMRYVSNIAELWTIPVLHGQAWVGVVGFSKVVAAFNHVGGSFNLFMATTGEIWIIQSFWIGYYVLRVENVSSPIVANISESSFLLSPYILRLCWRKTLPENYYPYLLTCSSFFFYSRLLSWCLVSLFFSFTLFWLVFIAVCGSISAHWTTLVFRIVVNWYIRLCNSLNKVHMPIPYFRWCYVLCT